MEYRQKLGGVGRGASKVRWSDGSMVILEKWASEDDAGLFLRHESLEDIAVQAGNDGEGKNWMGMEFWPVGCEFRRNVVKV